MTRLFFLVLFLITLSLPVQAAQHIRIAADAGPWLAGTGMFIGFIFLLVGIELTLRDAYWRRHAERTEGKIAGVELHFHTHKGHTRRHFATVYRYTLSNGREYTGVSDVQSMSAAGRETGAVVPLLVFPDNPRRARPAAALAFNIGYLIFFVIGAGLFGASVLCFPPTQMTWIMLGVMALIAVWRILQHAKARTHPFAANDADAPAAPGPEAQAVLDKISADGLNLYARQAQDMLRHALPRRPFYPIEDILKSDAEHGRR